MPGQGTVQIRRGSPRSEPVGGALTAADRGSLPHGALRALPSEAAADRGFPPHGALRAPPSEAAADRGSP
jgi:hypothetical protein